jgi:homoserine kinase
MTAVIRIPASTSNLGAGFDALSLALNRYLKVTVERADSVRIEARGVDQALIPTTADNLIVRVAQATAEMRGRTLPAFRMAIDNEIPLARGMGSSAAAIIAGITCYEVLADENLAEQDLFRCAFEFESHPDNLAAALHGGLVATAVGDNGAVLVSKSVISGRVAGIVVIPSFELSTEKARSVLPQSYSRKDVVYNIQRSALTIAALTSGDWTLMREAMRDRVHQPFRAKLIPGLEEILSLELGGLFGIALSGAGPTVFAFVDPDQAAVVGRAIEDTFKKHGVDAKSQLVDIDRSGRAIQAS